MGLNVGFKDLHRSVKYIKGGSVIKKKKKKSYSSGGQCGGAAASQHQGTWFNPELVLLFVWRFICFSHVQMDVVPLPKAYTQVDWPC